MGVGGGRHTFGTLIFMNFPMFLEVLKFTQISSVFIDISACLRKWVIIHFPLPVIRFLCSRARLPKWL